MWVARWMHSCMLVALVALGWFTPELSFWYGIGVTLVALLLLTEHWLVRGQDLLRVNVAFLHVNGIISTGLFVVTLADLYLPRG